jgi:hypothetical protein
VSEFSSSELTLVATATDAHAEVVGSQRAG